MKGKELLQVVEAISRERNVEKETLLTDIEQAMVSAARKHFNAVDTEEFVCELDRLTGSITLYREGEAISIESLGRIPAQTAKQVMIQRFREDERASLYEEYSQREGELVTGVAQRYEGGALVVQIGRAEGFMPRSEQIPGEQHQPGERVRCLILEVRETSNQVKIVLSRAHPNFIRRLFEVEVPEVMERVIEIKAMAREPGHRTKIAVSSIDSKVDAVGACVGVRGSRIKNIVDELAGEKIDIVRWNESSQILIQNALKPADVVEISLCFELGKATVVVNEDQLSLAIGRLGQNVRLAARLTNWDIDIVTPAEFTKSLDVMDQTLRGVEGVTEDMIDRLAALGVISVLDVEDVGVEYLAETLGCDDALAQKIVTAAAERSRLLAEEQQREKEAAAKAAAQGAAANEDDARAAAILGVDAPAPPEAGAPEDGTPEPATAQASEGAEAASPESPEARESPEAPEGAQKRAAEGEFAGEAAGEGQADAATEEPIAEADDDGKAHRAPAEGSSVTGSG
ncbi:MAG: transcription termination/antitermination protein NusA [Phycisphaeraceae bacterium]|nr:transcription termination/antitermination protein NusA [Phycisphaeraceae bacterium]